MGLVESIATLGRNGIDVVAGMGRATLMLWGGLVSFASYKERHTTISEANLCGGCAIHGDCTGFWAIYWHGIGTAGIHHLSRFWY